MNIEILSQVHMQKIHEASLAILDNTGLRVEHPETLAKLADAGARVDIKKNQVRFPPDLVTSSIAKIPRTLCWAGRDPEYDHVLSRNGNFLVRCGSGDTLVPLKKGGGFRAATLMDQKEAGIVSDGLDAIGFSGLMSIQDVPPKSADLHATKILLENSRKHFMGLTMGAINTKYLVEMQLAVRGTRKAMIERPLFHAIICPMSPLYYPADEIERLKVCGENGLPLKVCVEPMLGASAPVTLAGTLAQGNAEVLGAFTLLQILYPGTPTVYYCYPSVVEMRSGSAITAGPENLLLYSAFAQLGRQYYEMPSECPALISDGFIVEQTLLQKGVGMFMAAASGAVILSGAGTLDAGLASSLTQLAIDDEIVQFIRRIQTNFDVDNEKIGMDTVDQIGPRGSFIASEHTYKHFRDEIRFYPNLLNFNSYSVWSKDPKGIYKRAKNRVADILKRHEVPPLEDAVIRELEKIVKAADQEILS